MKLSDFKHIQITKKDGLIILAPIFALIMCLLMTDPRNPSQSPLYPQTNRSFWFCFLALCASRLHVVMTVFRSHLNPQIIKNRVIPIILVPTIVLTLYFSTHWFFKFIGIIVLYWDMWHSSMQIYGFSRIYDFSNKDNTPHSQNIYFKFSEIIFAFSIVLIPHFLVLFSVSPAYYIEAADLFIGSESSNLNFVVNNMQLLYDFFYYLFILASLNYILSLIKRSKLNYHHDVRKYLLYFTVATASIVSAFRVTVLEMICLHNLYHAFQYYLSLYYFNKIKVNEKDGFLSSFLRSYYKPLFLISLLSVFFILFFYTDRVLELPLNSKTWLIFSILHFYADGFIWSVSKNEVSAQ